MSKLSTTKVKILGVAVILASALATPAMAQPVYRDQIYRDQIYQDQAYRHNGDWQNSYNRWDERSGFWPADVAAGGVGGAVGTAAAIATAPIGGEEYARRNGFVCIPGTLFRGEDGRRHVCQ
jgi:hypothetical protein